MQLDQKLTGIYPTGELTQTIVRELLDYDPETGALTWRWRAGRMNVIPSGPFAGFRRHYYGGASSRGSTGRVGTLPASPFWKPRWEASGLSCSRRSRLGSSGPQSCSILTSPPYRPLCPHLRRPPGYSRSCQSLRPFIATQKSERPLSPLGASREAALSSSRMHSSSYIAGRSYWRRPETTCQRSIRILPGSLWHGPSK
jgi:hypothetical protein